MREYTRIPWDTLEYGGICRRQPSPPHRPSSLAAVSSSSLDQSRERSPSHRPLKQATGSRLFYLSPYLRIPYRRRFLSPFSYPNLQPSPPSIFLSCPARNSSSC